MAMTTPYMRSVIRQNGHLVLEGTESREELRVALLYLRSHTFRECHQPELGTPVEALIPRVELLYPPARTRVTSTNVKLSEPLL